MSMRIVALALFSALFSCQTKNADWQFYGGDSGGSKFSELKQISLENVKNLEVAWEYETGEPVDEKRPLGNQCQPIVVDGVLYGTTSRHKLFAVDASNGTKKWEYDPYADLDMKPQYHPLRGVVFWEEGDDKRILYAVGPKLLAVNAIDGKRIESFGEEGFVDLHLGIGDEETLGYDPYEFGIRSTSPGIVFEDLIIMGSSVSEGGSALPGYIRAYNVKTGALAWVFHTIPLPGEFGYETWASDSYKKLGAANCWAGMVVDQKNGRVFMGTGSPSVDFYGGARPGQNLFANCIIALDARTGERVWHFQTVHHDLWDKDIPCPPNLLTVQKDGRKVEAVAQATKDGYVFLLDRATGEPLFPVEEVPVPTEPALPGEQPWPTQPVPVKPAPFSKQSLTEDDLTDRTEEAHEFVLARFKNSNHGHKYMPPSEIGSLLYGIGGGAEWGGAATDPNGILYVNGNNMLWWLKMSKTEETKGQRQPMGERLFNQNCSACHSRDASPSVDQTYPNLKDVGKRLSKKAILSLLETGRGRMPSFQYLKEGQRKAIVEFLTQEETGRVDIHATEVVAADEDKLFPYTPPYLNNGNVQFLDTEGYPAIKPLWGTLNAIDMNTGEYLWKVPFGEFPELKEKGMVTGTENHGGPLVTAGGLLFIGATYDEKLRAFDSKTGEIVWEYKLPAGGFASPISYMVDGTQYIAISAGGARYGLKGGSKFIAFALKN